MLVEQDLWYTIYEMQDGTAVHLGTLSFKTELRMGDLVALSSDGDRLTYKNVNDSCVYTVDHILKCGSAFGQSYDDNTDERTPDIVFVEMFSSGKTVKQYYFS